MNPKVFISHASEDKNRFVINFAKKLRKKGVDAWLDQWEMLPGDSIVDKIFEEGINDADVMIIVLSQNSVSKDWVKEELNAGIIKKIENNTKLIPLIIDDCEVPEALKATVWQRIEDLNNYDNEFEKITNSIFGTYNKPNLGTTPNYASTKISIIPNYTKEDTIILKEICEQAIESGRGDINISELYEIINQKYEISKEIFNDSIEILDNDSCFNSIKVNGGVIAHITLTTHGFELYAKNFLKIYDDAINEVAFFIINSQKQLSNTEIEKETELNSYLIIHILDLLESKSLIKQIKLNGGNRLITSVKPELKRLMRKQ